jgi:hypothetical protein
MVTPFQSIEHSTTNFWPSIVEEIRNNDPIKFSHETMKVYFRENVPTIEDFYVGPLCNKPSDPLSPKDNVVEGQMLIV